MSAGNCNCEMCLQRWVASLQRLDAFATVGCTAVHRRGAHCAPVYLRCYNNLSSGRAKGHRGDRKAPICNRPQNRRFCRARNPYGGSEKCNCEMRLQRWVASLQRLDAFATVGCTAVHRRGAHCAPVYLRCYNNPSRGRAKGHRGDRKAPICNRRQGRRP